MKPRDKVADSAYWDRALDVNFEALRTTRATLVRPDLQGTEALATLAKAYFDHRFRRILMGYSAGAPIPDLAEDFADAFGRTYPDYLARHPPGSVAGLPRPPFSRMARLLSLGVLCGLRGSDAAGLVAAYDAWDFTAPPGHGVRDRIWDAFAVHLAPGTPRPAPATGVNFEEAYAGLWAAIDPDTEDAARAGHLKTFLDRWHGVMDAEFAAESGPLIPTNTSYVGNWCLEAAAGAVVAGIDDSKLRRHKHYPKDFADHARGAS